MNIKIFLTTSLVIFVLTNSNAQRLDRFGNANRISYAKISTYFGYADSLSKPDEVRNDTAYYFMYFWMTDSVHEIGLRIISPVPEVVMPDRGDVVSENYYQHEKDKTNYFDTWIALDRAVGIKEKDDIPAKLKVARWISLGFNDDSSELFPQPTGKHYNSLLRIVNQPGIAEKSITAGLYRIRFAAFKKGKVRGGYVIQVGTTEFLPSLKLVKNPEELKD